MGVWVTFIGNNKVECECTKGIDVIKIEYDLDEYNNYREAIADFILDAGIHNYKIQTHYAVV